MSDLLVIKKRLEDSDLLKEILGKGKEIYVLSVLSEIAKTQGDDKKDLTVCDPQSIVMAIKQACDLGLEIDARQHCHLIKYGNKATLQVGYRGFIYAIKRAYPDANIVCNLVYEDDKFMLEREGDRASYVLTTANPFAAKDKVLGGFCHISYTLGSRLVSFCETISIEEIKRIQGCAKQDFIWKAWFEEKAKIAIIKRACKIHFSGIQEIAEITEFDNQDYDLNKEPIDVSPTIDSEQAFELEELAKKAGKDLKEICEIYKIDSIIQLPAIKFEQLKSSLNANS